MPGIPNGPDTLVEISEQGDKICTVLEHLVEILETDLTSPGEPNAQKLGELHSLMDEIGISNYRDLHSMIDYLLHNSGMSDRLNAALERNAQFPSTAIALRIAMAINTNY